MISTVNNPDVFYVKGTSYCFIRPDNKSPQYVMLATQTDVDKNPNDFVAWALDFANDGGFLALFDGVLQSDLFQVGTSRPGCRGHMGICTPPMPTTQLGIHDLPNISLTLSIYSNATGIWCNGSAPHADRYVSERGDIPRSAWICWHQGSSIFDWRAGMEPGTYDLVIMGGDGVNATTPDKPGNKWMTFHRDSGGKNVVRIDSLFQCKEILDLQAKVQALEERIIALENK